MSIGVPLAVQAQIDGRPLGEVSVPVLLSRDPAGVVTPVGGCTAAPSAPARHPLGLIGLVVVALRLGRTGAAHRRPE